jgi:glycosyl transferase family 25
LEKYLDNFALNRFDAIVYINLEHRTDRKEKLLAELDRLKTKKEKIHRVEAFYTPLNGHRGCAYSHYSSIKLAKQNNWNNVLILEDDCIFTQDATEIDQYISTFLSKVKNWDVFFLSTRVLEKEPSSCLHISRILKSTQAHAYVVNAHYYDTLMACFHDSYNQLENNVFFQTVKDECLDQKWHDLQSKGQWYAGDALVAKQDKGFSDIELKIIQRSINI